MVRLLFLLVLAIAAAPCARANPTMQATDLTCEYLRDPLGMDALEPRLGWILQAATDQRDLRQSAYRILVASSPQLLSKGQGDLWDSGKVASSEQNNLPYKGKPLGSREQCFWKVQVWDGHDQPSGWSRPARWEMGLQEWKAKWLSDGKAKPTKTEDFYLDDPAPMFRKEFRAGRPVRKARLYITACGYYEATLNGVKVGDHVLDPGWTKFDERVLYSTFDVTKQVGAGMNCVGVMLGNGWFNPLPMKMWGNLNLREHLASGRPQFIAQLDIEYRDGSRETIISDETWKVGAGPILRNNVYLGEVYDARRERTNWDEPGFDDKLLRKAKETAYDAGRLRSQMQPPIRVTAKWNPVAVTEPKPGVFIYDCGHNFGGLAQLKLNVPKGTKVVLRYGELLHPDGALNPMTSVAGQIKRQGVGGPGAPDIAWQSDTFISKGGSDTYTPRFTFRGFRYLEVSGLPKALPLKDVTALRLNADVDEVGSFECANPMLNQVQEMCRRTFLSNLFSVQSDCPHREKMGYGGDIAATSEALMLNFDMSQFYAKVVADFADSARPDGKFTDTAPFMGIQYCGVVWAMAHPLLIEQLHQYYGNTRIAEEQYEAAKKWLMLVEKQYPDGIVMDGLSDHEGLADAPAPEMVTPFYYRSTKLLEAMAHRLGRTEDERAFWNLGERIKVAYAASFGKTSGRVGAGTQAAQAFGLATGIVNDYWATNAPHQQRQEVLAGLISDIAQHKGHLTTGILGTKHMLDELSKAGRTDIAYQVATQPDFPGWGWMLKNGATTLWEHWEFSDNTFSHNHPMFGSVSEWMMKWLGGIQPAPDAVGFDKIVIAPQTVKGLDWVKSSYQSIRGKIVSNWRKVGDRVEYEIVIPVNAQATVKLPGLAGVKVLGSGRHKLSAVIVSR